MQIGLIFDFFQESRGGAELYLAQMCRELATRGHTVLVFCRDGEAPHPDVAVHRVEVQATGRGKQEEEFAARAVRQARDSGCVVYGVRHLLEADLYQPHGGTWAASSAVRLELAPKGFGRSLKVLSRRVSGKHRYFERADREIFENNRQMITVAVSPMVQRDVEARYGELSPRVEVLWPAVDLKRFHPDLRAGPGLEFRKRTGIKENAPVGLFVGHDFRLKGLEYALAALPRSRAGRKEAHLLIAGRGDVDAFRILAEKNGLKGRSWFLQDRCTMQELYGAADFLIHPTHYDPCSMATIEAMAVGVPVITTSRNGAADKVVEAGGVVVEEPGDLEGLAAAIDRLVEQREELTARVRATVEPLNWEDHTIRMEALLQQAESARGAPG